MSVQLGDWKGRKLYIEGVEYKFPRKPRPKDFINYGKPKEKQFWERSEEYLKWDWNLDDSKGLLWHEDPEKGQMEWNTREIERFVNGVWIYINGEEVYLNNYTYFFLQWFMLEGGYYPDFRDSVLYYYRFLEICDKLPNVLGHTLLKARRMGATSMTLSALVLWLITTDNSNYGIVSNKGSNAKKAFDRAVKAFGNIPSFLRPLQEGTTAPKKVLALREQARRITKNRTRGEAQSGLNNELNFEATDLNSYDSYALAGLLGDEFGKYPTEVPVQEYLDVVKQCVMKGSKVVGKLMLPTTVNPPQEGGSNYKVLWTESNQEEADYLGRTKNGLYRIFIPAYIGFEGYITKYGESIINTPTKEQTKLLKEIDCPDPTIGAKEYLTNIRKQKEGSPESLQAEIRQFPFSSDEVFESANERCLFIVDHLNQREKELEEKLLDQGGDIVNGELGRRGWFERSRGGKVVFVDDPNGLWYVDNFLPEHRANSFRYARDGRLEPTNISWGAAGGDPVMSGQSTVEEGSDSCLIIRSRENSMDEANTGKPEAMFLGTMDNLNELYEQWFNGLIYYGVKVLAEKAPDNWYTYAQEHKLEKYLYQTRLATGKIVYGISGQQSVTTKDNHAKAQRQSSLTDWNKIPFLRLVRERKLFNVQKRNAFDACMADGYALMALDIPYEEIKRANKGVKFLRRGRVL